MIALWIGVGVVLILQILCLLALVDQYKGILQIRDRLELRDVPLELATSAAGISAADAGLPAAFSDEASAIGILLSTKCQSCVTVAADMQGRVPGTAWAVIVGAETQCQEFQDRARLAGDRVLWDVNGQISDRLQVRTFPALVLFKSGVLADAKSISSHRGLEEVIKGWRSIQPVGPIEVYGAIRTEAG